MLQALEHILDEVDCTSTIATVLVNTQKIGELLSPPTLMHYEQQIAELDRHREHMPPVIAR